MLPESPARPRIALITPALAAANNGNSHTALRWQRFLAPVAAVEVATRWDGAPVALMIALHARRSAESIARFHDRDPEAPLALVLTGTDLYRDLDDDLDAQHSLQCASALVVLQEAGLARLDGASRAKARVIVQSASAVVAERSPGDADFVAVGHLRQEKDPLTLMRAARLLAASDAGLTIAHIGGPLDAGLADAARATMADCPGYVWLGAQSHAASRRIVARARALVHPSRIEGGANVVVEAVRSRVPVLASRIDGNVGLLGAGYDGYFEVGAADQLARLMRRVGTEPAFAARLAAQCATREPLFRPAVERRAVRSLVADLLQAGPGLRADNRQTTPRDTP